MAVRISKQVKQKFKNDCIATAKQYPTLVSIQMTFPKLYIYFYEKAQKRHDQILIDLGLKSDTTKAAINSQEHKTISSIAHNIKNRVAFVKSTQSSNDIKTFINKLFPIFHCDNVVHNINSTTEIALEDVCNDTYSDDGLNPKYCKVWTVGYRDAYEQFFYIFKSIQSPQDYCTPYQYWRDTLYLFGLINNKTFHDMCGFYSQFNKANLQSENIGFRAYIDCLLSISLKQDIGYLDMLKKNVPAKLIDELHDDLQKEGLVKTDEPNPNTTDTNLQSKEGNTPGRPLSTNVPLNQILFGPPGTGKTYNTIFKTLDILGEPAVDTNGNPTTTKTVWFENEEADRKIAIQKFNELKNNGRIVFTTFHQSMSYEDFIEGIKPNTNKKGQVTYKVEPGIFKNICDKANKDKLAYVLIIDEINRGNVANIFGELITLIEDNKRLGKPEAIEVLLPYSKEPFSVPGNLYIIGTMNTADRSVEALDSALRRRFSFVEMMPKPELLEGVTINDVDAISLQDLLTTINKRIEVLKDREHQIGHSYFMKLVGKNPVKAEMLKEVFSDKIIPLLQEYFYGDYEKIRLVLGDGFVTKQTTTVEFAGGFYEDIPEYSYQIVKSPNMAEALVKLMNIKTKKAEPAVQADADEA